MTTLTAPLLPTTAPEPAALTLGDRLAGAWQELHVHGAAACPVCGDRMTPAGEAARCQGCGSELR
jgi:hypothetical protein